jgi:hypothetical protein
VRSRKRERRSGEDGSLKKTNTLFVFYHNFNEIESTRSTKILPSKMFRYIAAVSHDDFLPCDSITRISKNQFVLLGLLFQAAEA